MIQIISFLTLVIAHVGAKEFTLTVYPGDFYSSPVLKFESKSSEIVYAKIKLSSAATNYFVPEGDEQSRCMGSWNKLWGFSRCFGSQHHKDSDRFVFRRAQSCLQHIDGKVVEIPDCKEKDLIEIAAYAYDNSLKPFEHQGTLLKQFSKKINADTWYYYRITFFDQQSIYELLDESEQILEIQKIDHRKCTLHKDGYRLSLYFGGVCPSPSEISAEYLEL